MIYANIVSYRVFVSLRPGTHILADDEAISVISAEGYVDSAGPGYLRLQASGVYTDGTEPELIEGEEPMELLLTEHSILLVQVLEEGDTIEDDDDDDEDLDE
jgi:hypothetical protein